MTWLKRLGRGILLMLVLGIVAAGIYVWRTFPQLDGEQRLAGLAAPVTVERDASDVTHIKAATPRDTWYALGYVHAQERGWQMEFNRRVMHGTLSEVLGEATLETDKLLRTLGIMEMARKQLERMAPEARDALVAYADGVQAFYADRPQALSPEFVVLGVNPGAEGRRAWDAADSVGWSLMMALDLGGNWGNEFARLSAAKMVDTPHLWDLFPAYPGEPPASNVDFAKLYADLGIYRKGTEPATKAQAPGAAAQHAGKAVDDALRIWSERGASDTGTVEGKGSNNWVVAGSHSKSGKPLLANDPHLGLSAPAIWYFARLQAPAGKAADGTPTPALDVIGSTLPGLPFVVLGRTRGAAWGFTNTGPDVQDLYIEQINPANPSQYRLPDVDGKQAWEPFQTRPETIRVKGKPDVAYTVRSTRHGPVLSDAQKAHADLLDTSRYVVALRWAALEADNGTALSMKRVNEAQTVEQLVTAFDGYHSPMQSAVMADTAGHIGFKAVGKVPLRRPDNDIRGMAPAPGWDPRYEWSGWIPYAETPQTGLTPGAEEPRWIATANQRITPPGYPYFMGQDWYVPDRFDRIEKLLADTPKHDMQSMRAIQADQVSPAVQRLLPRLQQAQSPHALAPAAQAQLKNFNSAIQSDSAAPLIFAVWADELTRGLLMPRLGEERFLSLYGKRQFRGTVEAIMDRNDAYWCAPMSCAEQAGAALTRALDRLQTLQGGDIAQWQWGKVHVALSAHRPFGNVAALAKVFDVRSPSGGDSFTVNVGQYWPNDPKTPFATRHAASLRAIYDLSDLEKSGFIYQTGQSGLVFSSRYRDMAQEWSDVQYRTLAMDPKTIRHTLRLVP